MVNRNKKDMSLSNYQDEGKTRTGKGNVIGNKVNYPMGDSTVTSDVSNQGRSFDGTFLNKKGDEQKIRLKSVSGIEDDSHLYNLLNFSNKIRKQVEDKGKITKRQIMIINENILNKLLDELIKSGKVPNEAEMEEDYEEFQGNEMGLVDELSEENRENLEEMEDKIDGGMP